LFINFQLEERREMVAMKAIAGTGVLVLTLLLSTAGLSDEEGVIVKWKRDPESAEAYYNRGVTYQREGQYDKAWEDVHEAHSLGFEVDLGLLKHLREASGRQEKDNRKDTEEMPENEDWFQ
jgi:hypothetical protein